METNILENIGKNIYSLKDNQFPCDVLLLDLGTLQINNISEIRGMLKILSLILDYDYRKNIIVKDLGVM